MKQNSVIAKLKGFEYFRQVLYPSAWNNKTDWKKFKQEVRQRQKNYDPEVTI